MAERIVARPKNLKNPAARTNPIPIGPVKINAMARHSSNRTIPSAETAGAGSARELRGLFPVFRAGLLAFVLPLGVLTSAPAQNLARTQATDDDGVAFTVPPIYPAGVPLPNLLPNCVRCHIDKGGALSEAVWDFAASGHDHEELSCYSCHGGDITDDEKAHEGDFISGALSKLMDRCSKCHERESRFFNESPHHSEKIRFDYPICSTCHDNHAMGRKAVSMDQACASCHGARARAVTGEGESQIEWTARAEGSNGNHIRVEIAAKAGADEIEIDLLQRSDIKKLLISLPADASGKIAATAEEVIEAVNTDADSKPLIKAEVGGDSLGEGVIPATPEFALAGGEGYQEKFPIYAELARAHDDLWRSLGPLRLRRDLIPEALEEKIVRNRNLMMRLMHSVSDKPDPDEVRTAIERAAEIRKQADEILAANPHTEPEEPKP